MSTINPSSLLLETSTLKRWTVQDYHRMSQLGLLSPQERTELIAGQITLMAAKSPAHVICRHLLARSLRNQLGNQALVRTQDPLQLDNFSEPEPDLAIVRGSILDYSEHHPGPTDILLVIEVADSTLKYDTEIKDKLYAQSGIADYWIIDLKNRQLHIFRNPTPSGYINHLILSEPNQASPLAFPDLAIRLETVLPPIAQV
jgi:Uma2 family endonuclease